MGHCSRKVDLTFDIYIVGVKLNKTEYGEGFTRLSRLVKPRVLFKYLKRNLKTVHYNLSHRRYDSQGFEFQAYEVYPHGTIESDFSKFSLLTDEIPIGYNEFQVVQLATGNFDLFRRWSLR